MGVSRIVVELPEELVERAQSVGLPLDTQMDQIIALIEAQVWKREAAQRLNEIAGKLQSLPPEMKPAREEIEAEIRAYWAGVPVKTSLF